MMLPRAEPVAFGAADRPCFGWLHHSPPSMAPRDAALVICKPFGYEAICAHRSLRHFADAAATMGVPAFRFDYDGTGDSAGHDREPGRVDAWLKSVDHAIEETKRLTGVARVHLLGVRLGATLAATAASQRSDVAGLIAIVPVHSGKAWLREVNALEIAMRLAGPPAGVDVAENETESVGFVITNETREQLQALDLHTTARSPAPEVLILERDDMPSSDKLAKHLGALGASVERRSMPGYAGMMLDPHESVVPAAMIAATTVWLSGRARIMDAPLPAASPRSTASLPVAPGVEETARFVDAHGTVFSILSAPSGKQRSTRAFMLLNSGAIPHIGPSRLYVDLARRWAARGYLVLRFDQPGIGDSPPFPGEEENVVYSESALRGVKAALDFLLGQQHAIDVYAVGLCSGAYHALKGAVAGFQLTGVAVINPLVFFWKRGMSLAYPPYQVAEAAASYKRSALNWQKWKKLFTGKVDVVAFVNIMARRARMNTASLGRNIARTLKIPLREDLGADLQALTDRGLAVRFVFATGDPGEDLLRSQAGWPLRRLERGKHLNICRIEGPNHSFTRVWSRWVLTNVLEDELTIK
jgi:alpha-beta hydrolase superfamily lysophospholipase